jgi:hypothetical protein
MERTEIFELDTEEDVAGFCRLLVEGKDMAPKSLQYVVALTVIRSAKVRELYDEQDRGGPIEAGFHKLLLR